MIPDYEEMLRYWNERHKTPAEPENLIVVPLADWREVHVHTGEPDKQQWLDEAGAVAREAAMREDAAYMGREIPVNRSKDPASGMTEQEAIALGAQHVVINGECYGAHFNEHEYRCCLSADCENNRPRRRCTLPQA